MGNAPPPAERQLKRRPESCPFCNRPIMDELHWASDTEAVIDLACTYCDWDAHLDVEVTPPDAE